MLSPYSDSNIIYKRFLRASHSRNRPPFVFRTIVLHTQGCLCLWMHLYLPLIAQGIDLVRELRHILVGHDALALRNQCQ